MCQVVWKDKPDMLTQRCTERLFRAGYSNKLHIPLFVLDKSLTLQIE